MASCQKKRILLLKWQTAAEAYSSAVNDLANGLDRIPADEYDTLKREAERTRSITADSRNAFELHIDEHGC